MLDIERVPVTTRPAGWCLGFLEAITLYSGGCLFSRQDLTVITHSADIPMSILLVEDDVVNQKLAVIILEKRGHKVTVAQDGREALALLANTDVTFDLVLMDCQMPHMNGFEATIEVRKHEEGTHARIPIIAMTANEMTGDRERCIESGMDDYLSKPFVAKDLVELVERWAARNQKS
jgi:CheY-like chemotaxis protein